MSGPNLVEIGGHKRVMLITSQCVLLAVGDDGANNLRVVSLRFEFRVFVADGIRNIGAFGVHPFDALNAKLQAAVAHVRASRAGAGGEAGRKSFAVTWPAVAAVMAGTTRQSGCVTPLRQRRTVDDATPTRCARAVSVSPSRAM